MITGEILYVTIVFSVWITIIFVSFVCCLFLVDCALKIQQVSNATAVPYVLQ